MSPLLVAVLFFAVCFLLGSVPWGLIISKVFFKTDIRQHGSGNIGTTNALRTMGKGGAAAVFVLDFGKGLLSGFLATVVSAQFLPNGGTDLTALINVNTMLSIAFLGCAYGHIFSPWLGFKGGKGIAVSIGCLFITYGWVGAWLELGIFIVLVLITRYVSVGSIAAGLLCPVLAFYYFWGNWVAVLFCSMVGLTTVWAHRGNIKRLLAGTESKIGSKKKTAPASEEAEAK